MLNIINDINLIDPRTESHYRFHTQLDPSQYPQVHDFYEIVLVTYRNLNLQICGNRFTLQPGGMALIRPGDIHSKSGKDNAHINLAFPSATIDALFDYLCNEKERDGLKQLPYVPPVQLSRPELLNIQEKMQLLNTIPPNECEKIRTTLRSILFDVVTHYFLPSLHSNHIHQSIPQWLASALTLWQTGEHRSEGLDFFCEHTGYSKEHICRTFKRCFDMAPTVYLNRQRLNYAINLLLHSDYSVTDIAYESGFCSPSRFYHTFRNTYGISPKQFCSQYHPSFAHYQIVLTAAQVIWSTADNA